MDSFYGAHQAPPDYSYDSNYQTPNYNSPGSLSQMSFSQGANLRRRGNFDDTLNGKATPLSLVNNQRISSWFYDFVNKRQLSVLKVFYIVSLVAFFGLSLISRLVLWAPLESIGGVFGLLFSLKFWFSLFVFVGLYASSINYLSIKYLFNVNNESFPTVDRTEGPPAFMIFSLTSILLLGSLSVLTGIVTSWMQTSTGFLFAALSLLITAGKIATENDFRLYFANDVCSPSFKYLFRLIIHRIKQDVFNSVVRTSVALRYSTAATFVLSILSPPLRNHLYVLFDPILLAQIASIIFAIFVLSDILCFTTNIVLMDKVEFSLPTPYFFSDARSDVVNIVNALQADDVFMRLFAFRDFYIKAKSANKTVFFTLSQPGNHPRLWISVFDASVKAIKYVTTIYLKETENVLIKNSAGLRQPPLLNSDRSTVKSTLLVPPTLKPKQIIKDQRPLIDFTPLTSKLRPYTDRLRNYFISAKPFVSSAETDVAILAIGGMSTLVENSYTLDKYGSVQKTLPQIVGVLLDLGSACDQLIRAKSMRQQTAGYTERRVFAIRDSAIAALTDIATAFQNHIYDLSLTPNQLKQLNEFANTNHL